MKRTPLRKISNKRLLKIKEFNRNVPQASILGIHTCSKCGCKEDFRGIHRSHIKSRSLGGNDEITNIEYVCAKCHFNGRHGAKEILDK